MKIRKYTQPKAPTDKRLLANMHQEALYRTRQVQAICYVSLAVNLVLVASLLAVLFR